MSLTSEDDTYKSVKPQWGARRRGLGRWGVRGAELQSTER